MNHNTQTRYALGWAALLCMYCAPYSAPAQSQDTHAEAMAAANSTQLAGTSRPDAESAGHAAASSNTVTSAASHAGSAAVSNGPAASGGAENVDEVEPRSDANHVAVSRDASSGRHVASSAPVGGGAGVVNINSAGAVELERLPRIGPARAQAILALRTKLRQFSRVEQLLQVKGIGRATFRMLRPLLALNGPTTLEHKRGH